MMASKVQERIYLEWLLDRFGPWPAGSAKDCEEPDFLIGTPDGTRGVEVINIHVDDAPEGARSRKGESVSRKFLRRLASLYYEKSVVPIHVGIVLLGSYRPDPGDADLIVDFLLRARDLAPWQEIEETVRLGARVNCRLYVDRLPDTFPNYSRWECISDHVGFVSILGSQHIQRAIDKKARKLSKYREKCDHLTLLVVADRMWRSGKLHIEDSPPEIEARGFDEVWLLVYPVEARRVV